MKKHLTLLLLALSFPLHAQQEAKSHIERELPYLEALYKHLHEHPEISYQEMNTGKRMAEELRQLGFEVSEHIGGYGVVGIFKNGDGPTIMVRTDTDGLPMEEKTGLPYASKDKGKDDQGKEVPAMHACGHDMHMTSWVGTARILTQLKSQWKGTLLMVAQPAEERANGAKAMLNEGLFSKFPKPDYCLALHCNANLPTGKVAYCPGPALASVDIVEITVYGKGGHGAYPHTTIDPIVLASRMVLDFQTIVSRETPPTEPSVVTVGSFHAGTKPNIIPDEAKLQLTLRSYSEEVRQKSLKALERIARGIALSAGLPEEKMPKVELANESIPATYNTPDFTEQTAKSFRKAIGDENVVKTTSVMGGEDFGLYGKTAEQIPISIYWLGTVDPQKYAEAQASGTALPSLHSSLFAPVPLPTIKTGVATMVQAVMDLMSVKGKK